MTPPPSPRASRRDATDNRAAIVAAAALLLRTDPDASVEAIAGAAGLSRRALYGHFASRDVLVTEVLAIGAARIAASVADASHEDPAVEIALVGSRIWSEIAHVRVVAQLALREPFGEAVELALEPARDRIRSSLARGAESGRIRTDIDTVTLAHLVERAAIAVLTEAAETPMTSERGAELVMLNGLATAGFGWRESQEIAAVARAAEAERAAPGAASTTNRQTDTTDEETQR